MKQVYIKRFSNTSMVLAVSLSVLFIVISVCGSSYFGKMNDATQQYLISEKSALQLQKGSDILTEQVRMFVLTGETKYLDGYFEEAKDARHRDTAVEQLRESFSGTQSLTDLENALGDSKMLMEREYYAMRLAAASYGLNDLPEEVASVVLSPEDSALSPEAKLEKSRDMVSDSIYQGVKTKITDNVDRCVEDLLQVTQQKRNQYSLIFRVLYLAQDGGLALLVVFLIISSVTVRKLIVNPLVSYNTSIAQDETVPVIGAAELQSLAMTYNRVFQENQATQKIIRHEAEYDALSELLNRGSFNKMLALYTESQLPHALLIADIDCFKNVNDTYGHAVGDQVIQHVANKIKAAFRHTDYVFRIGGDEYAVIMLDTRTSQRQAVEERLDALRESLKEVPEGVPPVTISVGIAFSDRQAPAGSLFQDADKVLYGVKESGKDGYRFYGLS